MQRVIGRLLACVLLCGGCATAQGAAPAPDPTARAGAVTGEPAREDVDILRERVTRLERRLADVDAKLGLLLAQRQPRDTRDRAVAERAPAPVREPYPLRAYEPPREEASLGARAIDLPPRGGYVDDDVGDVPVMDGRDEGAEAGDAVVIKLDGRGAPASEAPMATSGPQVTLGASIDEVYQWAQARMKAGQHLEALAAFEDITEHAPQHDLADNAMYWTGACHAARGDHKLALDIWQRLPIRYPKSPKVPDALFGMAQSHEALGEPALAETLYLELVNQYPKAEKVREAQKALRRLRPR